MAQELGAMVLCDLFAGLREDEIVRILRAAEAVLAPSGQVICRQGDTGHSMFLIQAGRVRVSVDRHGEGETTLNYLGAGNHFGELSMLIGGPRTATVRAVMDTELLELKREVFHRLMATVPGFAANLSRTLGIWLRGELGGARRRSQIATAAVVRCTPASQALACQLTGWLARTGQSTHVLTDRPHLWPLAEECTLHPMPLGGDAAEVRAAMHRVLMSSGRTSGRVVVDLPQEMAEPSLLMQCERVYWTVDAQDAGKARARLSGLLDREPNLASRVHCLSMQRMGDTLAVCRDLDPRISEPPFRMTWRQVADDQVRFRPHDIARLAHQLQGVHLGLALGGGGARGVAHIGVLQVLEKEGLYFDRIAGTSAGAMLGSMFAAGYPAERLLELVLRELTPPAWMRWIPKNPRWYLLALYRLGMGDPKLRKYLFDYSFEHLLLPMHTISVDLVTGSEQVRHDGDVVDAILESINLPVISAPILRNGAALVDGGVLINVPASVLRKLGADFVLAVDVGSRLAPSFGGNEPGMPTQRMRRPGLLETVIRVTEVQQRGLASIHAADADYILSPDTSAFAFDDFGRAAELIEVGRVAAERAVPEIKQLLSEIISPQPLADRRAA